MQNIASQTYMKDIASLSMPFFAYLDSYLIELLSANPPYIIPEGFAKYFPLPHEKKSGGNTRHIEQFRVPGKT